MVIISTNNNNHFSNYLLRKCCVFAHIIFKKNSYSIKLGKDISYWTQTTDKLIPMLPSWWRGRGINITIYYYRYHWLQNISDFKITWTVYFDSKNKCNIISYGYNPRNNIFHIEVFFSISLYQICIIVIKKKSWLMNIYFYLILHSLQVDRKVYHCRHFYTQRFNEV